MDSNMYTVKAALDELNNALAAKKSSHTLYGIAVNCTHRVAELFPKPLEVVLFKKNATQPCATFYFKAS